MKYLNWVRILIVAVFIVLMVKLVPQVKFDNSFQRWVPPGTTEIEEYRDFLKVFAGDAFLLVTLESPTGFEDQDLKAKILRFRKQAEGLKPVIRVIEWPHPLLELKKPPDPNTYSVVITFKPPSYLNPNRPKLLMQVKEFLKDIPLKHHLAGTGVLFKAVNEETRHSTKTYMSTGIALLLVVLLIILRKLTPFFSALGVAIGGVITMLIASVLFEIPLSMVTMVLPVLLLFYGTSNSLHILFHGGDFVKVFKPCLLTTITTCLGFAAFLFDPIPLLQGFAILAISGLIGSFIWCIVFFYPHRQSYEPRISFTQFFENYPVPRKRYLLVLFTLIFIALIPGFMKLKSGIDNLAILPPDNEAVVDHYFIQDHVSNYIPLEYSFPMDKVYNDELQAWIEEVYKLPEISGKMSYFSFPFYLNPNQFGYLSEDGKKGRITFFIPLVSSSVGIELVGRVDKIADRILQKSVKPKLTGYVTLYGRVADEMGRSFGKSLGAAFILVFFVMGVYLRDFKLFLAAIGPNAFPIFFILGIMGWFNITLDPLTLPIGCLLLSIVVDDTIHFLYWYKKTQDLTQTFKEAGPAILLTSFILVAGFAIFIFAPSPPIKYFGLLTVTALLTAIVGDFVMLPLILRILNKDISQKEISTRIEKV